MIDGPRGRGRFDQQPEFYQPGCPADDEGRLHLRIRQLGLFNRQGAPILDLN